MRARGRGRGQGQRTRACGSAGAGWPHVQVDVVPAHPCCSITERCPGTRVCVCTDQTGPAGAGPEHAPTDRHVDSVTLFRSRHTIAPLCVFWCVPSFPLHFGRVPLVCGLVCRLVGSPSELCELCPCPLPVSVVSLSKPQLVLVYCLTVSQPGSFRTRQPRHHSRRQISDVTTSMLLNQLRTLAECGTRRESSRSVTTSRRQLVARGWVGFPLSQDLRPPYTAVALKGG